MEPNEIESIRLRLGYSQAAAAAKAGVSTAAWNHWELGNRRPHKLRLPVLRRMQRRAEQLAARAQ